MNPIKGTRFKFSGRPAMYQVTSTYIWGRYFSPDQTDWDDSRGEFEDLVEIIELKSNKAPFYRPRKLIQDLFEEGKIKLTTQAEERKAGL